MVEPLLGDTWFNRSWFSNDATTFRLKDRRSNDFLLLLAVQHFEATTKSGDFACSKLIR